MIGAHVAGIPVEETLLGFAPLGVAGVGALVAYATQRVCHLWRRPPERSEARPAPGDPL
jgi:hypothetical protein